MVSIPGYTNFVPIATGGFSRVFEAVQAEDRLRRKVAVKVLSVDNQAVIDRNHFTTECRALGEVSDHPNIITVFDSGFTDRGYPFIAMELCETDLARRITDQPQRCLAPREVVEIGARIATALAHAHKKHILHRDIKPQNILFNEHGVRLTDFGIASLPGEARTQQSWALSRHYAAPEVIDEEPYTEACDLYSLGATLYTALDGRRPFDNPALNQPEQVAERIRTAALQPFTAQAVPDDVRRMVASLMAKHPQDRPRTAADVAQRFEEIGHRLDGRPTALASPAVTPHAPGPGLLLDDSHSASETTTARENVQARPTADFEQAPADHRAAVGLVIAAVVIAAALFFTFTNRDDSASCPPMCAPATAVPQPTVAPAALPSDITLQFTEDDGRDVLSVAWGSIDQDVEYRVYPTQPVVDGQYYVVSDPPLAIPLDDLTGLDHCIELEAINLAGQAERTDPLCSGPAPGPDSTLTIADELQAAYRAFWLELSTSVPRLGDNLADENERFTVFVPSPAVLAEFRALIPREKDNVYLRTLEFHVLEGALTTDDLLPGVSLTTQAGVLLIGQDGSLSNGATIARTIETANGLIHLLDGLMLPPGVEVLQAAERMTADLNDLFRLEPIQFAADDDVILAQSIPTLDRSIDLLMQVPEGSLLEIRGHTDTDGSEAYNLDLGQRRADSVRAYLLANGVTSATLSATSSGEAELKVDPEVTEDDKAQNRRIEWFVLSTPG